jgi:hypothetical protein
MLRDNFDRGLPPPGRSGRSIRFRNGSPLRKFANSSLELKFCSWMHLRLGVAILWSASLSRDEVLRSLKAREGWSFEKSTNLFCSAIDLVRAAHPGIAWHVDLNGIANSDSKRRRDHHRLKRRFFRSIDAANSRAIKN